MRDKLPPRVGFSAIEGRRAKAQKIIAILTAANRHPESRHRILDIGSGSGEIADFLRNYARVVMTDVVDQRIRGRDLPFVVARGQLPFADASFDLVVSNHVIEHSGDPSQHLQEIRRVVRPDGPVYLATPNRWWPWEVHTRLPLSRFLPASVFPQLAARLGRLSESLLLVSNLSSRRMTRRRFEVFPWHARIVNEPRRYHLSLPRWAMTTILLLPGSLLRHTEHWQLTLFF